MKKIMPILVRTSIDLEKFPPETLGNKVTICMFFNCETKLKHDCKKCAVESIPAFRDWEEEV